MRWCNSERLLTAVQAGLKYKKKGWHDTGLISAAATMNDLFCTLILKKNIYYKIFLEMFLFLFFLI